MNEVISFQGAVTLVIGTFLIKSEDSQLYDPGDIRGYHVNL